jgi:8-oxo-dGTP pyrophosphatase MutT (NUDIX family)
VSDRVQNTWQAEIVATLTENPYFAVREQLVTRPDGESFTFYAIDFPRPSVGVVARRGGEFLLIRQYRFLVGQWVWAIASGGVGEGESPQDAARRELLEETGYAADRLVPIVDYFPSYGSGNQEYKLYLADEPADSGADFDRSEVHDVRWFSGDELKALLRQNGIVDGLSLVPLLLVLLDEAAREHGDQGYLPRPANP